MIIESKIDRFHHVKYLKIRIKPIINQECGYLNTFMLFGGPCHIVYQPCLAKEARDKKNDLIGL